MKRALPIAALLLAILPSFALLFIPILEEDAVALIAKAIPLDFWGRQGRLAFWPVSQWVFAKLAFPTAATVLVWLYCAVYTLFIVHLARMLGLIFGSWGAGCAAAAIIGLHFHFHEARVWNGCWMLAGAALQLAAMAWTWRAPRRCAPSVALATFAAFNLHQAGALIAPALCGIAFAAVILRGENWLRASFWKRACAGFLIGGLVYGLELILIVWSWGLPPRLNGSILFVGAVFLASIPLWAALPWPIAPMRPPFPTAAFLASSLILAVLMIWAWRSPRNVPRRRRARAVAGVAVGFALSSGAALMTDGLMSSRVLVPPLVALWGGLLLFIAQSEFWKRATGRAVLSLAILALFVIHSWNFAHLIAIKADAWRWTRRIQHELALNARDGDHVRFDIYYYLNKPIDWGDSGRSLFNTKWGAEGIADTRKFTGADWPASLNCEAVYRTDDDPGRPLLRRTAPDQIVVDCSRIVESQRRIEDFFHLRRGANPQ